MRKTRIIEWILCILVALGIVLGEGYYTDSFLTEKTAVNVYAPEDMTKAFNVLLSEAGLKSTYEITIVTDESKADIVVSYGKKDDSEYTKFAFSPFVIAYGVDSSCLKALKDAGVVSSSEYADDNDEYYEIDFLKVIDECIEEGKWENLGLSDKYGNIEIFYPSKNSIYWEDFYDFLIVTVNGGTYPDTLEKYQAAEEYIDRFLKSSCTVSVDNFDEKVERTNGFPDNAFYVIPEKLVYSLATEYGESVSLFFPFNTVNFNYYIKANSEIGETLLINIDEDDFYKKLKNNWYRSNKYYSTHDGLFTFSSHVYYERDVYNVIDIPDVDFLTSDNETN